MTFLNASLLFGLMAAAVPLVLHLISRREPKTVPFPAVRFLTERYQSNRSRLQVRRWWLLALRMLAIAAIAVTLARPAISRSLSTMWLSIGIVGLLGVVLLILAAVAYAGGKSRQLIQGLLAASIAVLVITLVWAGTTVARGPAVSIDQQAPAAVAILIDNGPTSEWRRDTSTQLDQHRSLAVDVMSRLVPSSRVAILDRSAEPASFAIDVAAAISQAESVEPLETTMPMESRIDAAVRLVRTSDLENRHVFVISDLAVSTWSDEADSLGRTLAASDAPVAVTVIAPSPRSGLNRSLGLPRISDPTPPRQTPTPVAIVATLARANGSGAEPADAVAANESDATSLTVEMSLYQSDPALPVIRDGEIVLPATTTVDRTSVRLAVGQSSEVVLTIPPLDVGTHHGRIELIGDDPLAIDDVRYFTIRVLESSPLLIVGDVPDETRLIAQAIAAPFDWDATDAEFAIDRVSFEDLSAVDLDPFAAVVLLDPTNEVMSENGLREFVAQGGGLLMCLGPAAEPGKIDTPLVPPLVRRWRIPDPGTFLQVLRPSHPTLADLHDVSGGVPWNQYPVQQYWQVETRPSDIVLINYASTGHAALVEPGTPADSDVAADSVAADSGAADDEADAQPSGRCLILTTPLPALSRATSGWNQLFATDAWPAFLLLRQAVDYLSGRDAAASTVTVGQPSFVPLPNRSTAVSETGDPADAESDRQRIQLFAPGQSNAIPLDVRPASPGVAVSAVEQSGTYWLRSSDVSSGFSANLPLAASNANRIDDAELERWFGADGYQLVNEVDEIDLARGGESQSVLLQSPAMLLALIVFVLEQVLSNRFYRSGATSTSPVAARRGHAAA